jgi:hypothetical protein
MNVIAHKDLITKRWNTFSLFEQLGNIGSEISRAQRWQGKDEKIYQNTVNRALGLFDLTLDDPRWKGRKKEIARSRELFCYAALKDEQYKTSLEDLNTYFTQFATAAQLCT